MIHFAREVEEKAHRGAPRIELEIREPEIRAQPRPLDLVCHVRLSRPSLDFTAFQRET
ncbi:hypothetical protein D3C83_295770 [compost metagenome]